MLFPLLLEKCYQVLGFLCLLWSSEGLNLDSSYPSSTEKEAESQNLKNFDSTTSNSFKTPSLNFSEIRTLESSRLASQTSEPFSLTASSFESLDFTSSLEDYITTSSVTVELNILPSSAFSSLNSHGVLNSLNSNVSYYPLPISTDVLPSSMIEPTNYEHFNITSSYASSFYEVNASSLEYETQSSVNTFSNIHTPLMSLLVAPSSNSWQTEPILSTSALSPPLSLTTSSSDNESSNPNHLPVPADSFHKKLLMLVLRAEDCTRFSKSDFEKMLGKLMAKFGFNDVIPEVSNAKCYSHLNINVTVGGPNPTLRFLPNMDGKNNYTVDVLNRTFRIIKLEKVDLKLEKPRSSNKSSNIIAAVADHETLAYLVVATTFGVILVVCVLVCFIKCCCLRKPPKRYGVPKGTHMRLRPEDYTLTPIPRPSSLYVDYYRGSATADIYSTTSAGSIASTTPTVEQGVVQPFDTSIVPLEDSSNLPLDSSRDPSVVSVPVQSDLKTFNIHSLSGKGLRTVSTTDSKEQLNPKAHSRKVETKAGGVANPTFQRY